MKKSIIIILVTLFILYVISIVVGQMMVKLYSLEQCEESSFCVMYSPPDTECTEKPNFVLTPDFLKDSCN